MSVHTFKHCPHCGKSYEHYTTITKHQTLHEGCPFKTCMYCGKTFIDKDIKEPALKPYSEKGLGIINCFFVGLVPFGIIGILATIGLLRNETNSIGIIIFTIIIDLIYIAITVFTIVNRKKAIAENKKKYKESYQRLKNRDYAIALKNSGYKVPDKFLK